MNELKYEFDNVEEFELAMKQLDKYHDCEKCHDKIVCIGMDNQGNTHCVYCGAIVKYPKLKREVFEKMIKRELK